MAVKPSHRDALEVKMWIVLDQSWTTLDLFFLRLQKYVMEEDDKQSVGALFCSRCSPPQRCREDERKFFERTVMDFFLPNLVEYFSVKSQSPETYDP